jgi:monoamine oxidase
MPTPRTLNRVAVDRRMQREQRKVEMVLRKFEAGTITEEQADRVLNTVPPQMLQQMGFMPPPQQLM